jgi:hypothetical protein
VDDISSQQVEKLKTSLEKIRGVAEVMVRNFSSGSADIEIQARTDGQELSKAISNLSPGFRLLLVESSVDRLAYRVVH